MKEIARVKNEIRISGFATVYYFENGKEFYHPPERHNTGELLYVDRGRIIAITKGIGCEPEESKAIFHEPNEVHSHISNREVSNNMFVVTFTTDSPAMDFFKKKTFTLDKTEKTLSVSEITDALGCSGIHSFSRSFKRATGFSPSGYKESIF